MTDEFVSQTVKARIDPNHNTVQLTGRTVVKEATIPAGTALSNEVDLEDYQLCAMVIPVGYVSGDITVRAASVAGGATAVVRNDVNIAVTIAVTAGDITVFDQYAVPVAALRYIRLQSALNVAADTVITLILKV